MSYPNIPPVVPQQPLETPAKASNTLGLVALIVAAVGAVFACIPGALIIGWILLPVGFILSIVALVQRGKKKGLALTGLILSVVGTIIGIIVFAASALGAVSDAFESQGVTVTDEGSETSETKTDDKAEDASNGVLAFGSTATFDGGLSMSVAAPVEFTPSDYAAGTGTGTPMAFEVTLTNGTDAPFDPTLFYMTVSSGGTEASKIYDGEIDSTPTTSILPGAATTFKVAFDITDAAAIVAEVNPSVADFDLDSVLFAN